MFEVWPGGGRCRIVALEGRDRLHHSTSTCSLSSPPTTSSSSSSIRPRPLQWTNSLPRKNKRQPGDWNFYEKTESCYDLTTLDFGFRKEEAAAREKRKSLTRTQSGLIVPPRQKNRGSRVNIHSSTRPAYVSPTFSSLVRTQSGQIVPPRHCRIAANIPQCKEQATVELKAQPQPKVAPTPPPRKKPLQRASYCKVLASLGGGMEGTIQERTPAATTKDMSVGLEKVTTDEAEVSDGRNVSVEVASEAEESADTFWKLINSNMALNYFMKGEVGDNNNIYMNDFNKDDFRRQGEPREESSAERDVWKTPRESWMTTSDGYVDCVENTGGKMGLYARINKSGRPEETPGAGGSNYRTQCTLAYRQVCLRTETDYP